MEQLFMVDQDVTQWDANSRKFDFRDAASSDGQQGDSKESCAVQFSSSSPPPRRQASIIEGVLSLPPVAEGIQSLSDMAVGTLSLTSPPVHSSRRVSLPNLPALLSFLPMLVSHAPTGADESAASGDLRRCPSDSLHHHITPGGSFKEESPPLLNGLNADPNSVADMVEYMLHLQSPRSCSLDLQQEAFELFARVSKTIPPCSQLLSPVHFLRLEPIELVGGRRPVSVSSTADALSATRRKLDLIRQHLRDGHSVSDVREGSISNHVSAESATTSSLFYDPFAAKRRKERDSKRASSICWAVDESCTVRAVFSNPLSIPVLLDSVFPVFKGAIHKVFPAAVQIPPCCDSLEILLSVVPEEVGFLHLVGLQTVYNNATSYFEVRTSARRWYRHC